MENQNFVIEGDFSLHEMLNDADLLDFPSPGPRTVSPMEEIYKEKDDVGFIQHSTHNLSQYMLEFSRIKAMFSDFKYFDALVSEKLKEAIRTAMESEITSEVCSTANILDKYYKKDVFNTPERKLVLNQILIIFKTAFVVLFSKSPKAMALRINDIQQFLLRYPEFRNESATEQLLLMEFRNAMKIALQLIRPEANKNMLIKIAERLEGSNNRYVTGGGQKPAVSRRVVIYHKEGGTPVHHKGDESNEAPKRPKRVSKKRKPTITSMKKLKLLRLNSDELKDLSKHPSAVFDTDDEVLLFQHLEDELDGPSVVIKDSLWPNSAPVEPLSQPHRMNDLIAYTALNSQLKLESCVKLFQTPSNKVDMEVKEQPLRIAPPPPLHPSSSFLLPPQPRLQRSISSGWHTLPGAIEGPQVPFNNLTGFF
jgi:hypothetical protein